jgi:photosystem II stability/assembly factor-like uncharacterized protein
MKRFLLIALFFCSAMVAKAQYILLLSPNGGETIAIGSSISITWASIGINEIDIEYSSNNGASFTTIATNVSVFTNSYSWLTTGPVTSTGLIRLKESTTGVLTDVSAAPFNVVNPGINITNPSAGLIFNPNQQVNITWTGLLVSNNVSIFFSTDNGVTYDTVISNTPNFYNYDWIVPSVASTACKIKIIDAGAPAVSAISGTFTIQALPSNGTILSPNGGENLFSTIYYDITWSVTGTNIIDLEYSTDNGNTWLTIDSNLASLPASYSWLVPSINSSTVKVRIKNAINALVLDESNNNFTITQPIPTLYLSSPFGYENWTVGSTQIIQWTYTFMTSIKIEYSTNGGSSFNLISPNTMAADLSYSWLIPAGLSSNCIIRITDNNSATTSQNQNPFNIVNPSITLLSPNGGEIFNSNVDTIISWNGNLISNFVKIEYSTNNGAAWNLVANNLPNTNYYQWLVPNTPSANCKVRVSDAQFPAVIDQSNNTFTITAPVPVINLLSPNGSEQWGNGTNQTILWSSNNIANVKIEYSVDSGVTWIIINALVQANLGSYTWLVDAPLSSNALIKVSDASINTVSDMSNGVFEIFTPISFVDLLYPNGGEQISAGINTNITWNAQGIGNIIIEYSVDNGMNWQLIASGVSASSGSYNWNVPNIFSNNVKVRIRDNSNSFFNDQSAQFFSIIEPSIMIDLFPAGANYSLFSNFDLYWSSIGLSNQLLKLEYSVNNGLNWVTFATGVPNTGSYNWSINCPPNTSCMFKVSVENSPSIFDTSVGSINVNATGPAIVILTPLPQEAISAGSVYTISWNSYGINYVRIEYSLNGDTIFQMITPFASAANGAFYWNVPPNINAQNCKIKISNAANTNLYVISQIPFSIQSSQFFMISGNIYSILLSGADYAINWTQVATINYVNLDYSLDSLNWLPIVSNYNNSGSYLWTIPFINADSLWLRVQDISNTNVFDINDSPQKIILVDSLLELNNPPNGVSILGGSNYLISWNASGIDFIDIDFSNDNGVTWSSIATSLDASIGTFLWNVPNISTSNAFIRVKNSAYPTHFSQNQTAFTISNSFLNVTTPNGGELWNTNNSHYITWQSLGVDFVNLYYSNDNGITYTIIDTNVFNVGYFNWQTPSNAGNNFKIKIVVSNNQLLSDESNATFSLSNLTASLTLVTPNGGEVLNSNTGSYITWQSVGIANLDISYSINGGLNYIPIANNIPAIPAYYYWFVPDSQTVSAKIKISSTSNAALNDISNANFSIINDTSHVQLNYPNGGEIFNASSYQTIKWTALNIPFVKLYYSVNGGLSYNYISAVINDSTYIWQVPGVASTNCKIKIENGNDVTQYDETNTIFTINNQATSSNLIIIDSLNSNNFCNGASFPITFTTNASFNTDNSFRVHLSDFNGSFSNFTDIGGVNADSSGVIQCTIPNQVISGSNYTIRIVADNPVAISSNYNYGNIAVSKANAEFTSDKQLVLFPNTIVNFQANAPLNQTSSSNWNTGNGGNYNTFDAQHFYSTAGKYDVTHTITDTSGCSSTSVLQKMISVEHWFPNSVININALSNLTDIEFENDQFGCAIIDSGNCIITSDSGKTWTVSYTINSSLNSIFIDGNNWYIALENGAYLKSTNKGNTWSEFSFNNTESLNDIYFVSPTYAIAVGNNGKLLKFNGTSWQNQNTFVSGNINKIANNNNTTLVVGNNAIILKLQNNLWTPIQSPVNVNFNSVVLRDSLTGYIASDFGFILKTSDAGLSWSVSLSGADINFKSIACAADSVWAVGYDGIIYASIDNGNTWKRYSVGVGDNLNGITYINHKGYIVGDNGLLRTFNKPPVFVSIVDQIEEVSKAFSINCFPNPTADKVTISCNEIPPSGFYIKVVNIQGKTVLKSYNYSNSQHVVDLSDLTNGVYFLSVNSDEINQTFKIIKSK